MSSTVCLRSFVEFTPGGRGQPVLHRFPGDRSFGQRGWLGPAGQFRHVAACEHSPSGRMIFRHGNCVIDTRSYWLEMMRRVAEPVLTAGAARQLKVRMPVETHPAVPRKNGASCTYLEAVARLLAGIAPWLEADLTGASPDELQMQKAFRGMALEMVASVADPASPDFVDWGEAERQPLVDGAFLTQAFFRAPTRLWGDLGDKPQTDVKQGLERIRRIVPGPNNWLLFRAMVECFLARQSVAWDEAPIRMAVSLHDEWYKGDGAYGDGCDFHWDYYNSFVIHPMMIDVIESGLLHELEQMLPVVLSRARRYAAVQERLVAPDGTFPALGRSLSYRCGAFHLLAMMALRRDLPEGVRPEAVRGALAAVIARTLGAAETFDADGWLRIGLAGRQPSLGESYISTGSLYFCAMVFLPLGLPPTDEFWAGSSLPWTARRVWEGGDEPADSYYRE